VRRPGPAAAGISATRSKSSGEGKSSAYLQSLADLHAENAGGGGPAHLSNDQSDDRRVQADGLLAVERRAPRPDREVMPVLEKT